MCHIWDVQIIKTHSEYLSWREHNSFLGEHLSTVKQRNVYVQLHINVEWSGEELKLWFKTKMGHKYNNYLPKDFRCLKLAEVKNTYKDQTAWVLFTR